LFIGAFMAIHSLVLVPADKENVSLILSLQFIAKYNFKESSKIARALTNPNQRYLTVQG